MVILPNSTRKVLVAVADLVNEEKLYTVDSNGNQQVSNIPLFIGSTDKRILRDSKDDKSDMYLPAIGLNITSMDLAEDRIQHHSNKIFSQDGSEYTFAPSPMDYTIDVGLMAKKESVLFSSKPVSSISVFILATFDFTSSSILLIIPKISSLSEPVSTPVSSISIFSLSVT